MLNVEQFGENLIFFNDRLKFGFKNNLHITWYVRHIKFWNTAYNILYIVVNHTAFRFVLEQKTKQNKTKQNKTKQNNETKQKQTKAKERGFEIKLTSSNQALTVTKPVSSCYSKRSKRRKIIEKLVQFKIKRRQSDV